MPNYRYNAPEYARRNNCGRNASGIQKESVCRQPEAHCGCDGRRPCDELKGMPLAMAYVPWQEWRNVYEAEKGFHCGTIFEELNKPFRGIGGCHK